MNNQKLNQMLAWLDGKIAVCTQRQQSLLADERRDESSFEKVRGNIYDVFRTVLNAGIKTCGEERANAFFLSRLQQIPSNWEDSLEQAKQHNDVKKMEIEQIKLDAVREIKEKFMEIWEGAE